MARRNDHSRDEIRDMAITAAIKVLRDEGVNGLSTRKVASAIGYTVGTLYLVFRNVDEMLLHVNATTLDELYFLLSAELDKPITPAQKIKNMSLSYLEYARLNHARWSLLFTHQIPPEETIPHWFDDKVKGLFGLVSVPLREMLPGLQPEDCIRAVRVLWSGVHGACDLGLSDKLTLGGEVKTEDLIDSLVENYLNGMTKG